MLDATQALSVADTAARGLGWGGVSASKYKAIYFDYKGRPAWGISRNEIVKGYQMRFTIDAETGEVIEKRRLGLRQMTAIDAKAGELLGPTAGGQ